MSAIVCRMAARDRLWPKIAAKRLIRVRFRPKRPNPPPPRNSIFSGQPPSKTSPAPTGQRSRPPTAAPSRFNDKVYKDSSDRSGAAATALPSRLGRFSLPIPNFFSCSAQDSGKESVCAKAVQDIGAASSAMARMIRGDRNASMARRRT